MTLPLLANSELATIAWIASILGDDSYVATTLPTPKSDGSVSWSDTGFIVVTSMAGNRSDETGMRFANVAIDTYAAPKTVGNNKPRWGLSANLQETIALAALKHRPLHLSLLPGGFPRVAVFTVRMIAEPRRIPNDLAGYARYTSMLNINWGPIG